MLLDGAIHDALAEGASLAWVRSELAAASVRASALANVRQALDAVAGRCVRPPGADAPALLSARSVVVLVERAYHLAPGALRSTNRDKRCVRARQHTAALLREMGLSYPAIGAALRKDHSTVIHACRKVAADPVLVEELRRLRLSLGLAPAPSMPGFVAASEAAAHG